MIMNFCMTWITGHLVRKCVLYYVNGLGICFSVSIGIWLL